jgi:DNA polymerase/3'-5' exonuclease PolX
MIVERLKALRIVEQVIAHIEDECQRVEVAGSIRREKPDVKDGELVILPKPGLLARLDELVMSGIFQKARYGQAMTTRWGDKYRGLSVQGMTIEIYLAERDNFGWMWMLRTGPGEANKALMTRLKQMNAPLRSEAGCWWYQSHKLSTPEETDVFRLLALAAIRPSQRSAELYLKYLRTGHKFGDWRRFVVKDAEPEGEISQLRLF